MILASVEAANERALGRMMENVSDSFIGPYGMDKKDAQRYIFAKLYRKEWRRVLIYKLEIELESPTTAKASFKIFLARSDDIKSLEDIKTKTKLDAFRLEVNIVNEDQAWRVIKAKHRRLGAKELL